MIFLHHWLQEIWDSFNTFDCLRYTYEFPLPIYFVIQIQISEMKIVTKGNEGKRSYGMSYWKTSVWLVFSSYPESRPSFYKNGQN